MIERAHRDELAVLGHTSFRGLIGPSLTAPARRLVERCVRDHGISTESNGFVPLWNYQEFWDIRQDPSLYRLFADLLGSENLWVTVDRCHYKPGLRQPGMAALSELALWSSLHHDEPDGRWPAVAVQASIALADTPATGGAFWCVPSAQATGAACSSAPMLDHEIVLVPAREGDLLIWDPNLLHGSSPNLSRSPRMALYITMHVAGTPAEAAARRRAIRAGSWLYGASKYPGFDRPDGSGAPRLTRLGQQLVG